MNSNLVEEGFVGEGCSSKDTNHQTTCTMYNVHVSILHKQISPRQGNITKYM